MAAMATGEALDSAVTKQLHSICAWAHLWFSNVEKALFNVGPHLCTSARCRDACGHREGCPGCGVVSALLPECYILRTIDEMQLNIPKSGSRVNPCILDPVVSCGCSVQTLVALAFVNFKCQPSPLFCASSVPEFQAKLRCPGTHPAGIDFVKQSTSVSLHKLFAWVIRSSPGNGLRPVPACQVHVCLRILRHLMSQFATAEQDPHPDASLPSANAHRETQRLPSQNRQIRSRLVDIHRPTWTVLEVLIQLLSAQQHEP